MPSASLPGGMPTTAHSAHEKFTAALDALIEDVKRDKSVLAAILAGSLSHDKVWDKSDVDLVLVTIDDRKVGNGSVALYSKGVNVHAGLLSRGEFRRIAEGSLRNSFMHSFLAKGRLLYSHDDSIAALYERITELGERDTQLGLFHAAMHVLPLLYKAHKWMVTRGDLDYTALWILYTAEPLARLEVIGARMIADREVIPQAMMLNPALFTVVYADLLNAKKTKKSVQAALDAIDAHMAEQAPRVFAPVIEYLHEAGETRSCTEIEDHFQKHFGIEHVTTACEYLADLGVVGKASTAVRLTKRSNVDVQELAFFTLGKA